MSGGVGPCSEISLPKSDQHEHEHEHEQLVPGKNHAHSLPKTNLAKKGFFSLRQLNALALVIVFSASGMVCIQDFAFVVFSLIYIYFMSKVAFPTHLSPSTQTPVFAENNRLLGFYVFAGAVIGLFLPIAYVFEGVFEGDKEGIKAAVPHVFLLASQIFMEGMVSSDRFSLPIRVFVPVVYNAMRIFTIMEWLTNEMKKVEVEYGGGGGGTSARRLYIGKALAVANMAFWSFNLFGFLLPYYLPMAFKRYYAAAGQKFKD